MCGRPLSRTAWSGLPGGFAGFDLSRIFVGDAPPGDGSPTQDRQSADGRAAAAAPGDGTPAVPGGGLRIGDDDRLDVDAVLAQAVSLGYLTPDEWRVRSTRVAAAVTSAELGSITADLPVAELRRRDPVRLTARAAEVRREVRARVAGWLALAALMVAIWLAVAVPTGAWYPWPIWPILGTGIALVSSVVQARATLCRN